MQPLSTRISDFWPRVWDTGRTRPTAQCRAHRQERRRTFTTALTRTSSRRKRIPQCKDTRCWRRSSSSRSHGRAATAATAAQRATPAIPRPRCRPPRRALLPRPIPCNSRTARRWGACCSRVPERISRTAREQMFWNSREYRTKSGILFRRRRSCSRTGKRAITSCSGRFWGTPVFRGSTIWDPWTWAAWGQGSSKTWKPANASVTWPESR